MFPAERPAGEGAAGGQLRDPATQGGSTEAAGTALPASGVWYGRDGGVRCVVWPERWCPMCGMTGAGMQGLTRTSPAVVADPAKPTYGLPP